MPLDDKADLILVKDHITKDEWDKLRSTELDEWDELAALEYAQAGGFIDLDDVIMAFKEKDDPWMYIDRDAQVDFAVYVARNYRTTGGATSLPDSKLGNPPNTTEESKSEVQSLGTLLASKKASNWDKIPNLTSDQETKLKAIASRFGEVNMREAYSVTATALGVLKRSEYLILPAYMEKTDWDRDASAVGSPWDPNSSKVSFLDFVHIYALNKASAIDAKDPVFFALVRAEAVKMGWFMGQSEVRYEETDPEAISTFLADAQAIDEALEYARTAAFLIPFMAEIVFRTTGHHYLTGLADEYERKYQSLCSACLVPDLTRKLRANELWHWALHWVSPAVTRSVLEALLGTSRLPNAIAIRANSAPAGTALVTTSSAVIEAMESCNWADEVAKLGGYDFGKIKAVTKAVKSDVAKYHAAYFAYGVSPPTKAEKTVLDEGLAEAQKFAPIAQGFIDAMYSDSSLARAKALKKHADASPVLQRRALRVFRALAKADTEEIGDIFRSTAADKKPVPVATKSAAKS